jgi:hypothetical protein
LAFQGSLRELPLPDIIQLVAVSGKTGVFRLTQENRVGAICLKDGQIVHAESGERLSGEEAMYELATWPDGDFVFETGAEAPEVTIRKTNTNLLMEAARRIDEWNVLSKRIPSIQHIPVFREDDVTTSVSFAPNEWAIICKVDGRRSIEEIALGLQQSPFDVAKSLYGLITSGLLGLREDILRPFSQRLGGFSDALLERMSQQFIAAARDLTGDDPRALNQLRRAEALFEKELSSGRPIDAITDLLQQLEQAVLVHRGPDAVLQLDQRATLLLDEASRNTLAS